MHVGFVGAGHLGGGLATRLLVRGHEVTVYDPSAAAIEPLVAAGAVAVESPAAVVRRCTAVAFVVFDDAQLRNAIEGPNGARETAGSDHVFLVHSTVSAATILALAPGLREAGAELLDVGTIAANFQQTGRDPLFLVGGSTEALDRARPALSAMSEQILHVGALGMGIKAKIARNVATYWMYLGLHQGFAVAQAGGITPEAFRAVVDASQELTLGGFVLNPRDFPTRAAILHKDLTTGIEQAVAGGVDLEPTRWLLGQVDGI